MRKAALLMLTLGALSACGTNTEESAASGAGGGAVAGAVIGGPVGALAGAAVGAGAGTAKEKVETDGKPAARSRTGEQGMTGSTAAEPATPPPPSGKGYGYGEP